MCFLFHAWAFDDVITFEYLKSQNLIISRTKNAFATKWKTFFLISKVLSFRHKKRTSKNLKVFCVQGVQKGCIGNKWVNLLLPNSLGHLLCWERNQKDPPKLTPHPWNNFKTKFQVPFFGVLESESEKGESRNAK